jgi:CelD/BcsL family acetyltransferase involved in cellulose biosynthesis
LPPGSLLLAAELPPSLGAARAPDDACPVLALPGDLEALPIAVSRRLVQEARYQLRRLRREGDTALVRADAESLPALLEDLFRLHRGWWAARGEPGVVATARLEAFHAAASRGLLSDDLLRLRALRFRGKTLGVLHGFASGDRTFVYLLGLDPGAARRSPGTVLLAHAIEEAIAEGSRELDLLRGREPYKYRWGARDQLTWRLELSPRAEARPVPGAPAPGSAPPSG